MRPRLPLLFATVTAVAVALVPAPAAAAPAAGTVAATGFVAPVTLDAGDLRLDPADQARIDAFTALLPANWQERLAQVRDELGLESSPAQDAVMRAIDPSRYDCEPTELDAYVDVLLKDVDYSLLIALSWVGVLDFPTYDALLFGTEDDRAEYGLPHKYKAPVTQAVTKSRKFWDVDLSDVQTVAMNSGTYTNPVRAARVMQALFPTSTPEETAEAVVLLGELLDAPGIDGGRNPFFTLNAFAFTAEGETDPMLAGLPDKVVFGEGLASALDALGVGATGAKSVIGHEMAHHVQYEQGYFDSPLTGPEATRRTELMADSFSTYFLAHKHGMNLTGDKLDLAEDALYQVGDCSFTSNGHHGTPNQRLRAAEWGAAKADATRPPFRVLPSDTLYADFERQLPVFVAPDAA